MGELKALAAKLPAVPFDLTEKNKALLRQLESERMRATLLFLPETLLASVAAQMDALYGPSMKERMKALQAEHDALMDEPDGHRAIDVTVLAHPRLPEFYRRKVEQLELVLEGPDRAEAMDIIRSMIERVDLRPRASGKGRRDAPCCTATLRRSWRHAAKPRNANAPAKGRGVNFRWLRGPANTFTELDLTCHDRESSLVSNPFADASTMYYID